MIELLMKRREMVETKKTPKPYLALEALEDGTFSFNIPANTGVKVSSISYSTDGGTTWITSTPTSGAAMTITTPSVQSGDVVLWKGLATAFSANATTYCNFSSTCNFNVSGNAMSLKYGDNFVGVTSDNAVRLFCGLFYGSKIVNAGTLILPVTALGTYAYYNMFRDCQLLEVAPELPATTLSANSYGYMFYNCKKLAKSPDLLCTSVPSNGYSNMFYGCSILSSIKMMATSVQSNSLTYWVRYVASSGTFTKDTNITLSTGTSGIPNGWTVINI